MGDDIKEIYISLSDMNDLTGGAEPNNDMSIIKLMDDHYNSDNNVEEEEINVNSSDNNQSDQNNQNHDKKEININSPDLDSEEEIDIEGVDDSEEEIEINVNSSDNNQLNQEKAEENEGNNSENSNNDMEEIDLFDNSTSEIKIENRELLEEHERVYTDDIYKQLLQNELLSELPIEKQGKKYFQEIILDTVNKLIDLKNKAKEIVSHPDDYNTLKANISKGIFNTDRVMPIILIKRLF